jgi:hypothetical protein
MWNKISWLPGQERDSVFPFQNKLSQEVAENLMVGFAVNAILNKKRYSAKEA